MSFIPCRCHKGSVDTFTLMKYLSWRCRRAINSVPGVMQLLSNRSSDGRTSPCRMASASWSSANLADRNLRPRCYYQWEILVNETTTYYQFLFSAGKVVKSINLLLDSSWHVVQLHQWPSKMPSSAWSFLVESQCIWKYHGRYSFLEFGDGYPRHSDVSRSE